MPIAGSLTTPIVAALVDDIVTVGEDSLEEAIDLFLEIEKVVAEGAGGAGLAARWNIRHRFGDGGSASCSRAATSTRACWPRSCCGGSCGSGRLCWAARRDQ